MRAWWRDLLAGIKCASQAFGGHLQILWLRHVNHLLFFRHSEEQGITNKWEKTQDDLRPWPWALFSWELKTSLSLQQFQLTKAMKAICMILSYTWYNSSLTLGLLLCRFQDVCSANCNEIADDTDSPRMTMWTGDWKDAVVLETILAMATKL